MPMTAMLCGSYAFFILLLKAMVYEIDQAGSVFSSEEYISQVGCLYSATVPVERWSREGGSDWGKLWETAACSK
jgi:hypothetical protein